MDDMETLWDEYGPELVRFARRQMGGDHSLSGTDAEDVVQEAIASLIAHPPVEEVRNPRALLYQAVRFNCANLFRSWEVNHVRHAPDWLLERQVQTDQDTEVNVLLYRAIRQLTDRERVVALQRLMCGMTVNEVGEILGISRQRVTREANAVAAKLRVALDGIDDGPRESPEEIARRRRRLLFELAGATGVNAACRSFGVSPSAYQNWKRRYADTELTA